MGDHGTLHEQHIEMYTHKGHLVPLPKTKRSNNSGLGDRYRAHGDLVVPGLQVYDTKHFAPC